MSAAKHTPGLVKVQHPHAGPRGFELADKETGLQQVCQDATEVNARRLAACWNACDGIGTKRLEDLGRPLMQHLIGCDKRAARMVKERHELLEALQGILEIANVRIDDPRSAQFDKARSAIAKATEAKP